MKKAILASCLAVGTATIMAFSYLPSKTQSNSDCQYGHCCYIKKNGYRCGNCAQKGSAYCWSHRY